MDASFVAGSLVERSFGLLKGLCVREGFFVRRIPAEKPLPEPNTRSRLRCPEAPRDELLVGLSCGSLPLAIFPAVSCFQRLHFLRGQLPCLLHALVIAGDTA